MGKQDRHFVTALSRGLDVLSCFRSGSRLLGNQDISERCHLPKSTVSRLTYTLTKLGYLHYVKESGKYRLGTATLALGSAVLGRFEVRDLARPLMQELADADRHVGGAGRAAAAQHGLRRSLQGQRGAVAQHGSRHAPAARDVRDRSRLSRRVQRQPSAPTCSIS